MIVAPSQKLKIQEILSKQTNCIMQCPEDKKIRTKTKQKHRSEAATETHPKICVHVNRETTPTNSTIFNGINAHLFLSFLFVPLRSLFYGHTIILCMVCVWECGHYCATFITSGLNKSPFISSSAHHSTQCARTHRCVVMRAHSLVVRSGPVECWTLAAFTQNKLTHTRWHMDNIVHNNK